MKQQVSGSMTFDAGSLAAAAIDQLGEVLGRIETNIGVVAGLACDGALLSRERMAEVLAAHLPHGAHDRHIADDVAQSLDIIGYTLIAVSGPALAAALADVDARVEPLLPDPGPSWIDGGDE